MRKSDEYYMHRALDEAHKALSLNEVPIGAVVVDHAGEIIGRGYNCPIAQHDSSAHAEIQALRDAQKQLANYRLDGCTLYVTLEPCLMCAGAIIHARISDVFYAAAEPKSGMVESKANIFAQPWFNHQVRVHKGLLAAKSKALLSGFFQARRDANP